MLHARWIWGSHPAYENLVAKVSEGYSPEQLENYTEAMAIAKVIYQAATEGKDQLRYVAGEDAIELYKERTEQGAEQHYQRIKSMLN
ncbi:hypothetical protein NBRC110019_26220 [Neptunitalea chrysea]|uniref:Uncharacterized protein n=2 Tax=Neptunitalea chrysea TaxID=1647581 RepID=A0A9W6B676_9FLAO|nr:hypothetical protein NBRC110019_26220 [Neptunitalea chrysea]